jgi:aminoglycoside/choline kinase family phosphotransferase
MTNLQLKGTHFKMKLTNRDALRTAIVILHEAYLAHPNDDKLTRDVRMRLEEINILLRDYTDPRSIFYGAYGA